MSSPTTPVVQRTVSVTDTTDLPKLIGSLKQLAQTDSDISFSINDYDDHGRYFISSPTEEHLNSALEVLKQLVGAALEFSEVYVMYRETVTHTSETPALAKSPNKHNRLWVTATPLDEECSVAIDNGDIDAQQDVKHNAALLAEQYNWDEKEARKIWTYGPEKRGPNVIVDATKCVQYLHEIRDSVISGFQWATHEGPLCASPMRSVRFNIVDATMLSDAIHRGGGQIIPTVRRVCFAALLIAKPTIMEPIYFLKVRAPEEYVGRVRALVEQREGMVNDKIQDPGPRATELKAHMPVRCSLGFTAELNTATDGLAKAYVSFDHWERMSQLGNALDPDSKLYIDIVKPIRQRKGKFPYPYMV
jgi:elongation factor 2